MDLEVDGQDDPPRRHPAQLGQPGRRVVPVVDCADGQRDVRAPEGSGRAEALARTTGAAPAGRWPTITPDGSTATTAQCVGS